MRSYILCYGREPGLAMSISRLVATTAIAIALLSLQHHGVTVLDDHSYAQLVVSYNTYLATNGYCNS